MASDHANRVSSLPGLARLAKTSRSADLADPPAGAPAPVGRPDLGVFSFAQGKAQAVVVAGKAPIVGGVAAVAAVAGTGTGSGIMIVGRGIALDASNVARSRSWRSVGPDEAMTNTPSWGVADAIGFVFHVETLAPGDFVRATLVHPAPWSWRS